jgi:hypothetical protein
MNAKFFSLFFLSLFTLTIKGQIKFVDGYIVDNHDQRIACKIINAGNEESAMDYQYRLKEEKEIRNIELSRIKEFGIDNELKCIRALVTIDVSPTRISNLKDTVLEWDEGHAFIKVLVEGELATLYSFYNQGDPRFFYSLPGSEPELLFYKKFQYGVTPNIVERTLENHAYKEQLKDVLSCEDSEEAGHLTYTKKALVNYFIRYHECKNAGYTVYEGAHIKKGIFRLKPGVHYTSMQFSIEEFSDALPNILFSPENSWSFGVEAEYILPYNKYKWSLFAESNFYAYHTDQVLVQPNQPAYENNGVDYKTIEFPLGITHYMNLNKDHRLFVRTAFVPHIILKNSYIAFGGTNRSEFSPSSRVLFGGGYNYKRISLEFRYYTNQNLTMNIYRRSSRLEQTTVRLTYGLF